MKTLNLSPYGVEEMSEVQLSEVNGGIIWVIVAAVIYDIVSNGPDSVNSFKEGASYLYNR